MVGDCESEIEMADRAVALNPNLIEAWHTRGWVYRNAGLPEEAVRSFERAIRMVRRGCPPGAHFSVIVADENRHGPPFDLDTASHVGTIRLPVCGAAQIALISEP
jgi:tetratricopeptide (TPR) repeat protein